MAENCVVHQEITVCQRWGLPLKLEENTTGLALCLVSLSSLCFAYIFIIVPVSVDVVSTFQVTASMLNHKSGFWRCHMTKWRHGKRVVISKIIQQCTACLAKFLHPHWENHYIKQWKHRCIYINSKYDQTLHAYLFIHALGYVDLN